MAAGVPLRLISAVAPSFALLSIAMLLPAATRRLAIIGLKLVVLAVVLWSGHRTISAGLADLRQNGWSLTELRPGWAIAAGLLYLVSQLPCGWFWHTVLLALGQSVMLPRALRAYYIGHLGKYVPGKAMVVVLRAALVGSPHVKTSLAVAAVFYETFTAMAVGSVVAAIILLASHHEQTWLILGALALAAIVGVPTWPPLFERLMRRFKTAPANTEDSNSSIRLSIGLVLRNWFAIACGWFFAGASLCGTIRAIGVENLNALSDLPLCTATVALAVAAGFVSMLPAGVGVRDIVLLQLLAPRLEQLSPQNGQALALIAVIVLRLIWLASEAILAAFLYPLGASSRGKPASEILP
jgi:glycosyltransferase 2 family protein